jgi:serine/threonine protein kinase
MRDGRMDCLDANAVQDLMAGALDAMARTRALQHLDGCDDCRALISLLAREVTRDAAADVVRRSVAQPGKVKLGDLTFVETVHTADGAAAPAVSPDPLGATAESSLIMRSGTRQVGKQFGRYTIAERIGAGAMGVVYRADDPGLGRRVALKLLHKPDPSLTDRLIREARSMAQVNHPNVVQVYDAGVSEGSTYIAMELVTGTSLRAWQQAKHTVPEVIEKYIDAGRGLAAAHAAGVIHRDFKPDNVLVGSDERVRVTDFGLASARPSEDVGMEVGEAIELTHSGMVLGTPAYMAPEQFTGGNVDPRTDQFNFCVALYEALYGHRPFKGKTFDELGDAVCDGKVRPAPTGSRVSGALRQIVLRGISVRPGDRYPTMDHLLEDLGRDRSRAWRFAMTGALALAVALGLGIGADFIVRDRVSSENDQSFSATAVQTGRAFGLLVSRFDANANQMYHQAVIRDVSALTDTADFGIGDEVRDREERAKAHDLLASQDWSLYRKSAGGTLAVAIADYKGRLLFSSAGPAWGSDRIFGIPWFAKVVIEGTSGTITLQPTNDPKLVESQLLGDHPNYKLAFFFARTLYTGVGSQAKLSGTLVQALDASKLVDDIRLDPAMQLSIVSTENVSDSEFSSDDNSELMRVPPVLIDEALAANGEIVEADYEGDLFQVKAESLAGLDGQRVGHVVMARELDSVLAGFFPGARFVFTVTAMIALGIAIATWIQVRRLQQ